MTAKYHILVLTLYFQFLRILSLINKLALVFVAKTFGRSNLKRYLTSGIVYLLKLFKYLDAERTHQFVVLNNLLLMKNALVVEIMKNNQNILFLNYLEHYSSLD